MLCKGPFCFPAPACYHDNDYCLKSKKLLAWASHWIQNHWEMITQSYSNCNSHHFLTSVFLSNIKLLGRREWMNVKNHQMWLIYETVMKNWTGFLSELTCKVPVHSEMQETCFSLLSFLLSFMQLQQLAKITNEGFCCSDVNTLIPEKTDAQGAKGYISPELNHVSDRCRLSKCSQTV